MKQWPRVALIAASVLYPLLWYAGRERGIFPLLASAMLVLWLVRACLVRSRGERTVALIMAAFFVLALVLQQPASLYWYPVGVNLLMFILFFTSLHAEQSIVERMARLQQPDLPARAVAYTRRVTQIWCAFFVVNGSIAALLALLGAHRAWAIYTGLIAYILMAALFAGEYLYRRRIMVEENH